MCMKIYDMILTLSIYENLRCNTNGSGIPTESPTVTPRPLAKLYTVTIIQVLCSSTRQNVLHENNDFSVLVS